MSIKHAIVIELYSIIKFTIKVLKFLDSLNNEIKDGNGNEEVVLPSKKLKVHCEKVDASTQASTSMVPTARSVRKVSASLSRGRLMVEKALSLDKSDDIPKLQKNVSRSTTNNETVSSSKNAETAKTTFRQLKELDETLITRVKGMKAVGTGTFGTCYLAK
jgi:hypothetical protein